MPTLKTILVNIQDVLWCNRYLVHYKGTATDTGHQWQASLSTDTVAASSVRNALNRAAERQRAPRLVGAFSVASVANHGSRTMTAERNQPGRR